MNNRIKKYLAAFKNKHIFSETKEDQYYRKMFIENFEWNSSAPNEEESLRWDLIKFFLNTIEYKSNSYEILDLGCGRGWLTNLLTDYGKVTGIEPVKSVLEYARKTFPKINFILGTSEDLLRVRNFKKYDLIISSEVIEHIQDSKKDLFISNISKLLKDRGYLIITTPRKEAQKEWNAYMSPDQPVEDWMTECDLEQLLLSQSFNRLEKARFAISPQKNAPKIEIYQLWLFQKN